MPPLRLAVITGNFDTVVDGVSLTLQRQVNFLSSRGIPVRVFAPRGADVLDHSHTVVRMPSVGVLGTPYRFAMGLPEIARKELRAFQPTLVHITTPDWLGVAAIRWANSLGVPVVATYFTHFSSYLKHYRAGYLEPISWQLQRWIYRKCQQIQVPSESMAKELYSHSIAGPFVVNPFGVDLTHFSPAKRSDLWRQTHGLSPSEPVVLFVGRLVWEKGLKLWAKVVQHLEREGVPHRSMIVGEGPIRRELRERLPRTIFTGKLAQPQLSVAFASADIFFFPSDSETFGCVTVEALASGVPTVVADATGSRDIVQDGVTGILCPPGDETRFALAVTKLLLDPIERQRLARNGPEQASRFSWPVVLDKMHKQFEAVAENPRCQEFT
jgi:phosphatidylinositol alpha 1,6-mannosyltransferase